MQWASTSVGKIKKTHILLLFFSLALCILFHARVFAEPISESVYTISTAIEGNIDVDIQPSVSGDIVVDSQDVIVSTTCPAGYDIYISAETPDGRIYRNADDSSPHYLSPATGSINSPHTLENNQWGFNLDGSDAFSNVPTNSTFIKAIPNATDKKHTTVNYGIKATLDIASGNYIGTVIYSIIPSPGCLTGEFERAYYDNGKEMVEALDGNSYYTMQDMNLTICGAVTTPSANTIDVPEIRLVDTRDGQTYLVRKLADGNCWMTQDLNFKLTAGKTLTSSDTDIVTSFTPTFSTQSPSEIIDWGSHGLTEHVDVARSYDTGNSVLYNWYASTAGTGLMLDNGVKAMSSICPKGWQLPLGSLEYADKSYHNLVSHYGAVFDDEWPDGGNFGDSNVFTTVFNPQLTGYYWIDSMEDIGLIAYYRTAMPDIDYGSEDSSSMMELGIYDYAYFDFWSSLKLYGETVRCVTSSEDYITINFNGNGETSGIESALVRNRDSIDLGFFSKQFKKNDYILTKWRDQDGNLYDPNSVVDNINPTNKPEITLTAIWEAEKAWDGDLVSFFPASLTTMQGMTSEICNSVTTPDKSAKAIAVSATEYTNPYTQVPSVELIDTRDNETYTVRKLADGNCWMTQNLRLKLIANQTLTSVDSDTVAFTPTSSTQPPTEQTTPWGSSYTNDEASTNQSRSYDTGNTESGVLYNWYTATAGNGLYSSTSTDTTESICPKGWQLPSNDKNPSYTNLLFDTYGISSDKLGIVVAVDAVRNAPINFSFSSRYEYSGSVNSRYSVFYWSSSPSTYVNTANGAFLDSFELTTGNTRQNKLNGNAVRCVAR